MFTPDQRSALLGRLRLARDNALRADTVTADSVLEAIAKAAMEFNTDTIEVVTIITRHMASYPECIRATEATLSRRIYERVDLDKWVPVGVVEIERQWQRYGGDLGTLLPCDEADADELKMTARLGVRPLWS